MVSCLRDFLTTTTLNDLTNICICQVQVQQKCDFLFLFQTVLPLIIWEYLCQWVCRFFLNLFKQISVRSGTASWCGKCKCRPPASHWSLDNGQVTMASHWSLDNGQVTMASRSSLDNGQVTMPRIGPWTMAR